jgi:hypothetical protein
MNDTPAVDGHQEHLRETAQAAARVLADRFGGRVDLEIDHSFRDPDSRSTVLRCRVASKDGARDIPASVIVKRFRGDHGESYDPLDARPTGARSRLLNEWSGARFLQELVSKLPFGPAVLGADDQLGLVVLEDLGEGYCLADWLQGDDPDQAERALMAYATTLGRLHATTIGRHDRYAELHGEIAGGGSDPLGAEMVRAWLASNVPRFQHACEALGLSFSTSADTELSAVVAAVRDPGPFLAYSVGDTCPDNHRYVRDTPDYIRFYDMEFGGFQHALLDAAYLLMPFPTCWCVARLPEELPTRLEAAYRVELARGCPAAEDDGVFGKALAEMCAAWFVLTVGEGLSRTLEHDEQWGISSVRQRVPLRAGNFARVAERSHQLPALSGLASRIAERATARWGDEAKMPLYPAFRTQ